MLILTISVLAFCVALVIGRALDVYFRAGLMRKLTKKDYGVLHIVSKDDRNIRNYIVDFQQDLIKVGGNVWVIKGFQIYREDKPERGFTINVGQDDKLPPTPIKYTEGIPGIFVDLENMKPLSFHKELSSADSPVKPDEAASFIEAWINNQMMKQLSGVKNQQLLLTIVIVVSLISAVISLAVMDTASRLETRIQSVNEKADLLIQKVDAANPDMLVFDGGGG